MTTGETSPNARSRSNTVLFSMLLHCAVFSLFIYKRPPYVAPMLLPGDTRGTQLTLTYLPGRAPQPSATRSPAAEAKPVRMDQAKLEDLGIPKPRDLSPEASLDAEQKIAPPPTTSSPASANPDSSTGADSLGTGNINIAYLDSFRSPKPDLSSLPRGVGGDVVLDVTIDTVGRIIALKKVSGVGYGIDESVTATVQAWVFHPATKDGTPVVSEQELHFHYEHGRLG